MKKKILTLILAFGILVGTFPAFALKTTTPNIALGKPTTADSEYGLGGMGPALGNDGDIYTTWSQGYSGMNSFWQVDLQQEYFVAKVIVHARWDMDNDTARRNFEIQLSNDANFNKYETVYSQGDEGFPYHESLTVNVSPTQKYRYLRLQKTNGDYFTLGEVEVYEMEMAGSDYGNIDGQRYAKAAKLLDYLGIMEAAKLKEEQLVTRAEALNLAFSLLGIDSAVFSHNADRQMYYDVPPEHPYYQAVQAAWSLGWIDCPDDRLFRPEAFISGDAMTKILLHALGYGQSLNYLGSFPANVRRKASDIKLYRKMSVDGNAFVDQQTMVLLLYNALTVPAADIQIESDRLTLEAGENLLYGRYDLVEGSGLITGNHVSSLKNAVSYSPSHIEIDQKSYVDTTGEMGKWLGYRVDYFINSADQENAIVLYDCSSADNSVVTMQGRDLSSGNEGLISGNLRFTKENGSDESVSLAQGYSVIYNGVADIEYNIYDFKGDYTELTFLDNNRDGEYDIVFVDTYQSAVISSAGWSGKDIRVIFESGGSLTLPAEGAGVFLFMQTIDGGVVTPEMLESGDLITYAQSRNGKAVKLYAGDRVVSGNVEAVESGDKSFVHIDGERYEVHQAYFDALEEGSSIAKELKPGADAAFRLNKAGQIVALSSSNESGMFEYAVLLATDVENGISGNVRIKIYRENGQQEIWNLTEQVTIDRVKYERSEIADMLKSGNDALLGQGMVRARFTDGGIKEFDTPYINVQAGETKDNSLDETLAASDKPLYFKAALPCLYYAGDYRMYLRADLASPVFTVPADASGVISASESDKKLFEIRTAGTKFIDEQKTELYAIYDIDEFSKTPAAYMKRITAGSDVTAVDESDPVLVVDYISQTLDEDGSVKLKIVGYNSAGKAEFTADSELISVQKDMDGNVIRTSPITALDRGDIIHYTPRGNEISAFILMFDCSEDKDKMESKPGLEVWYSAGWATYDQVAASTRGVFGLALKRNKSLLSVCDRFPTGSNEEEVFSRTEVYNTDAKPIYIYNEAADRLQKASAADLDSMVYEVNPNGRVFVVTARANLQFIVGYDFENIG